MAGISAFGAYIPRLRLEREAIAAANVWFDAGLATHARGTRSMCNWDEDAVTLAVAAGRDCAHLGEPASVTLATTSAPFADRQCAGIAAEALRLGSDVRTMDVTGSQRAGTTALLSALDTVEAGRGDALVLAAEHRRTRVGSSAEMLCGDGAAALLVGAGDGLARLLGAATVSGDFVDHFRGEHTPFDYEWEERWVRDEGLLKLIPAAAQTVLERAGIAPAQVDHLIVASAIRRVPQAVAKATGIGEDRVADTLIPTVGFTGAAHPLLMLAAVLEEAGPGRRILVTGFGQGADALLFETTDSVASAPPRKGVTQALATGVRDGNYARFQTFNSLVERELGKRAEVDRSPALSAHHRNRDTVNGFVGGKCSACGTVQFPRSHYCVNPNCGEGGTQEEHPMAELRGRVMTYTADRLTFDLNPPAYYGLVEFEGGGRAVLDFTEVDAQAFDVGTEVEMQFRIKHLDPRRGYRTYFWKAAPLNVPAPGQHEREAS